MFEGKRQPLVPRFVFLQRIGLHLAASMALMAVSLGGGIVGYMATEGMSCIDAFLNAAMLLGGMGPVNPPVTFGGKLFAGVYALYAGLDFIVCAALIATPVLHRVLHRFHLDEVD